MQCETCDSVFLIGDLDKAFYQRMQVASPKLCPDCREQRRAASINQIHLFKRNCDATKQLIICHYPPNSPLKIFAQEYWYSDAVENTVFGREIDFGRPFFTQFRELQLACPRPALFTDYARDENSEYTNFAGRNKNCYLIFDSDECWDCYYGYSVNSSKNCIDCYRIEECELCYEAVDSRRCYNSAFIYNSENCVDSYFLNQCLACKNCIMCSNLRQKEYYVYNQKVSPEEYHAFARRLQKRSMLFEVQKSFQEFCLTFPQKATRGFQNENVYGNYLTNCKNADHCFDCRDLWDGRFCYQSFMKLKDCMDIDECGEAELLYECSNLGYNAYNICFSQLSLNQISNLTYCELCFNGCSDLFGCVGLKKKQYCILNKQYSKDAYHQVVEKLVAHMKETGEWGEFFPASCSTSPYNLSVANYFYPLKKEIALSLGYQWYEPDKQEYKQQSAFLPDTTAEVSDAICGEVLACQECLRNYKITKQELQFYRSKNIPLPVKCFYCRHILRLSKRAPRKLEKRSCGQCGIDLSTAFNKEIAPRVYCEPCFQNSLE